MSLTVREAVAAEHAAIDELLVRVYVEDGYLPAGQRISEGTAERAGPAAVLVAVDGDAALLGSVTLVTAPGPALRISRPGEAELRLLAVAALARGCGVGAALTRACIDRAREAGSKSVVLATLPTMDAARRLYERFGFVRVASRDLVGPTGAQMLFYELAL